MKTSLISLILICAISKVLLAQVLVVDTLDLLPVPFVQLISDKGKLIGISDINGKFYADSIVRYVESSDSIITLHHISYQNKYITFNKLKSAKQIYLDKREFILPEVTISPKQPDVLVLKGYFRSYQLEDSIPKYYTDGIVEYYLPLKTGEKIKNRLISHRSFYNKNLLEKEKKRKVTISMVVAGVPYIYAGTSVDELSHAYHITDEQNGCREIDKNGERVGIIRWNKRSNKAQVDIDLIAPIKEETKTLFNYTSRVTKNTVTENYFTQGSLILSKENLESRKEYREFYFKHKKDDHFTKIDVIHEFYVLDSHFSMKSDTRKIEISSFFGLERSTFYTNSYWEDTSKLHIPELNHNIAELLEEFLSPY